MRKAGSAPVRGMELHNAGVQHGAVGRMVEHALPRLKLWRQLRLLCLHYRLGQRHHILRGLRTCAEMQSPQPSLDIMSMRTVLM